MREIRKSVMTWRMPWAIQNHRRWSQNPGRLPRIPILVQGKADGGATHKAGHSPEGEEGETDVAQPLEGRQRKHSPELQEEGGLEEHDGGVVAQC
jgi:hypothetical protein